MAMKKSTSNVVEVKRTWYNKKTGEIRNVTYTYPKKRKSKDGKPVKEEISLVYKSGKKRGMLRKSRIKDVYDILVKGEYVEDNEIGLQKVKQRVEELIERSKQEKRTLTVERAVASYTENRIAGMIINAGYSIDEFAEEYQVSVNDLLNPDYWNNIGGGKMEFKLPQWNKPKEFEWASYYVGASSFVSK